MRSGLMFTPQLDSHVHSHRSAPFGGQMGQGSCLLAWILSCLAAGRRVQVKTGRISGSFFEIRL